MVDAVVHSAVAVVDEGGEGRHGRRRRLFADAGRVREGGEERYSCFHSIYKEQQCLIKRIVLHCLLRHGLRDAAGGDGGDDLLPDESPHAEEYAPSPLLQSEGRGGERCAAKLNNYDLQGVSVRISGLVRRE